MPEATARDLAALAAENPHAGQGMVVLDIGGDVGALIVSASAALAGAELEICPAGARGTEPDEGGAWWQGEWRHPNHAGSHPHGHAHPHAHGHPHGHAHEPGTAWPHVAVLPRPGGTFAAVFPGLRAGAYELWVRPGGPSVAIDVRGGEVTTTALPDSADSADSADSPAQAAATSGP